MKIRYATLETCAQAEGTVVVIDVLRAFTTAAYAFGQGVNRIYLVGSVKEALDLKERLAPAFTMGEVDGKPVPEFDFSNSPTSIAALNVAGQKLIHRSTAGIQGILRSKKAARLLAASFVVAGATARFIHNISAEEVTFVITGAGVIGMGDEDAACANYLSAILMGERPDPEPYLEMVRRSPHGRLFGDPAHPEFPASDLDFATRLDAFDFVMEVHRTNGQWILEKPV